MNDIMQSIMQDLETVIVVLLNLNLSFLENTKDPDQLASDEVI